MIYLIGLWRVGKSLLLLQTGESGEIEKHPVFTAAHQFLM